MAIVETLVAKTVSENLLHQVVSVVLGVCSTLWLFFAVGAHVTSPVTIAERVGDYLGFTRTAEKLAPVAAWADEPRHLPLFIGTAVVAAIFFNLSGARVLPIHTTASEVAWLFFLPAVQGAGFFATAGICLGFGLAAFGIAWSGSWDDDRRPMWNAVETNIAVNFLQAFYPFSILVSWFFLSYKGDQPAGSSVQQPMPDGAVK